MNDLSHKKCVPCEVGALPFNEERVKQYAASVPGWTVRDDSKGLSREWKFPDFKSALAFANGVGAIAEEEGHHPDLEIGWGRVKVSLSTHAIGGLSENDFILAAKISAIKID